MMTKSKPAAVILNLAKYLGIALVTIGIPIVIFDQSGGAEIPLLTGLFTLLISTSKHDDERSAQIKTTSVYVAFIIAYAIKLLTTNLYDHSITSFELVEINHFLILTLASANIIYFVRLHLLR